jgi:predicted nuclease of predicted toxin-antitoxin system
VKLLFDENLSPTLVKGLHAEFPQSEHVFNVGLGSAPDLDIWRHAEMHGFIIVTKDYDFEALSALRGSPPKLVLVKVGNATTRQVEDVLRRSAESIRLFGENPQRSCLIVQGVAAGSADAA